MRCEGIYSMDREVRLPNDSGRAVSAQPERSREESKVRWPKDSGRDLTSRFFM